MQEQLITFETAKLAKEKRFDWSTKLCYHLSLTESVHPEDGKSGPFGWEKGELYLQHMFHVNGHKEYDYSSNHWYTAAAPTQSLLQKWLREVHQIYVTVEVDCTTYPKFAASCHRFIGNPTNLAEKEWYWKTNIVDGWTLFRTYEEALEEGLQEALKLIEI